MREIREIREKRQRGQALVEFAMVLPVLILLVVGMMQFGLLFHEFLLVTHAAREGARVATLGGSDAEIVAAVNAAAASPSDTDIMPASRVRGAVVCSIPRKYWRQKRGSSSCSFRSWRIFSFAVSSW